MSIVEFCELSVGKLFHLNGNDYQKNSSRTARMLSNGRIFYIGKHELINRISW